MAATPDSPGAARLVFLHGFTQTHHHWHRVAHLIGRRLAADDRALALVFPDLPGHGLSGADRSDIAAAADELAAVTGPATYIGYSMGGRVALHAAIADASPVERLVLIGATPGIADGHERTERRQLDDRLAGHIADVGVDAFLDEWLATPLFATLDRAASGLVHRRRNTAAGLMHSLRTFGTGAQASLWADLGSVSAPTLVLAGELDTKFTAIGHSMVERLPDARFVAVEGAGHAAHAERPELVAGIVAAWLSGT